MTSLIQSIIQTDTNYPKRLKEYLKTDTPETIWIRGNINLLRQQKEDLWGLFCSNKCPGEIILKTHDLAQKFKEDGVPTISGFHSPIEKECLRVLLRGTQPILWCMARGIEKIRLNKKWKEQLAKGRLIILSTFTEERMTAPLASSRNLFVAALANKILIAHAAEDSKTLDFTKTILKWDKPVYTFDSSYNKPLLQLGVTPFIGG